jgi:hypothetical protein
MRPTENIYSQVLCGDILTHIVKAVKGHMVKKNQKFGIIIPRTVEEALQLDRDTNTTYWADAIAKEMKNNRIAFKFLSSKERVPQSYKFIPCHMNFEVKMNFTRKAHICGRRTYDRSTPILNLFFRCFQR